MIKKNTDSRIDICTKCRGEGSIYHVIEPARHGSEIGSGKWEECPICTGTGMVCITIDTIVTIEPHHKRLSQE